jgi:hypothetical protein
MDWGPNTDEDDKRFLERSMAERKENPRRNFTLAVVVLKDTNDLIGSCGIYESSPIDREGWIGYCLKRRHWRQGFGTGTAKGASVLRFQPSGTPSHFCHLHACKHGFCSCLGEDGYAIGRASPTAQIDKGEVARFAPLCHPRPRMVALKRKLRKVRFVASRLGLTVKAKMNIKRVAYCERDGI